jgi:hypothetical protein
MRLADGDVDQATQCVCNAATNDIEPIFIRPVKKIHAEVYTCR